MFYKIGDMVRIRGTRTTILGRIVRMTRDHNKVFLYEVELFTGQTVYLNAFDIEPCEDLILEPATDDEVNNFLGI